MAADEPVPLGVVRSDQKASQLCRRDRLEWTGDPILAWALASSEPGAPGMEPKKPAGEAAKVRQTLPLSTCPVKAVGKAAILRREYESSQIISDGSRCRFGRGNHGAGASRAGSPWFGSGLSASVTPSCVAARMRVFSDKTTENFRSRGPYQVGEITGGERADENMG